MVLSTLKNLYKPIGSIWLLLLLTTTVLAQKRETTEVYFIKFTDKDESISVKKYLSDAAIIRRNKYNIALDYLDIPANPAYINRLKSDTNIIIRYSLKWHNGVVVNIKNETTINYVKELEFVKSVHLVGKANLIDHIESPTIQSPQIKLKESSITTQNLTEKEYGMAYSQNKQIGAIDLHKIGFDGDKVKIAVFDAGFKNIDEIPGFLKSKANNQLNLAYDVAGLDNKLTDEDSHGTAVTSCIGAYDKGKYVGSAPNATLYLFRTEFSATEYPIEELNWCKAAEIADSIGVDMITSSLGYNQYDDKTLSYTHADLDGMTSYVSLGARTAVAKGIVVLNSAGNSGDNKWKKIGTPADVPSVLTIGAVDYLGQAAKFSSRGYNANNVVKPDVAALGVLASVANPSGGYYRGYGTSYSTPITAGGVACLMQALPQLSPKELTQLIRHTANHRSTPNPEQGYGTAQLYVAYQVQSLRQSSSSNPKILNVDNGQATVYVKDATRAAFRVVYTKRFLKIFKIKKKLNGEINNIKSDVISIDLSEYDLQCIQKHTLIVNLTSSVGKHRVSASGLLNCQ